MFLHKSLESLLGNMTRCSNVFLFVKVISHLVAHRNVAKAKSVWTCQAADLRIEAAVHVLV